MIQKKFKEGIEELSKAGLNLFATINVSDLPLDILESFKLQQIPYHNDQTLVLLAHGGKTLWKNLSHPLDKNQNPIDQFSLDKMQWFAKNILENNIQVLFPHNEWTIPLQKLGRATNLSRESLLKIDICEDYGLWFAFRGAFLTDVKIHSKDRNNFLSPCDNCELKPCLKASQFIEARVSCPYKKEHRYEFDQIQYHLSVSSYLSSME